MCAVFGAVINPGMSSCVHSSATDSLTICQPLIKQGSEVLSVSVVDSLLSDFMLILYFWLNLCLSTGDCF